MSQRAQAVIAFTDQQAALHAAAAIPELSPLVLLSDHCSDELWTQLYRVKGDGKLTVEHAKYAAATCNTQVRVDLLLTTEKRASVIKRYVEDLEPGKDVVLSAAFAQHLTSDAIVRVLKRRGLGPGLADEWATRDAAALHPYLRAWRLTATDLPDGEVLDEVANYGSWGDTYSQPPLSLVFAARPHLFAQFARTSSAVVRTQLGVSHLFGTLTPEEQIAAMGLGGPRIDETYRSQHAFAWQAAYANPTASAQVRERLEQQLELTIELPYFRPRRRHEREWEPSMTMETLDDPDLLDKVASWAIPGRGKGKPAAFCSLVHNPHLTQAHAAFMHSACREGIEGPAWLSRSVSEAIRHLDERFSYDGEMVAQYEANTLRGADFVLPEGRQSREARPRQVDDRVNVAEIPLRRLTQADYQATTILSWVSAQLGDDPDTWTMFFQIVDTLDNATTLGQLVAVVRSL